MAPTESPAHNSGHAYQCLLDNSTHAEGWNSEHKATVVEEFNRRN